MSKEKWLGCLANVRRQLGHTKTLRFLMNASHQLGPNPFSWISARNKEVVDVATRLNIRITNYLVFKFNDEWVDFSNAICPYVRIEVRRCPRFDLFRRVVVRSHFVDGGKVHAEKCRFITESKSTNFHEYLVTQKKPPACRMTQLNCSLNIRQ